MTDRDSPIGVFDSGLGGLTVVRALRRLCPQESLIYFGDTARVPYGTKSKQTVTHFSQQILDFLLDRGVKMVVVACNTVSALALDDLKANSSIPILGVISPGANAAARLSRSRHVGVVGTTATVHSAAYPEALKSIDKDLTVTSVACPLFVPLAEEGWTDGPVATMIARTYLEPFWHNRVDTLILGCTHYPLLKDTIQASVPDHIQLVDSAEAVSAAVQDNLKTIDSLTRAAQGRLECYVTDLPQKFEELGKRFLGDSLPDVSLVQLE